MSLHSSELLLIIRARDEASRALRSFAGTFGAISGAAADAAKSQVLLGAATAAVGAGLIAVGVKAGQWLAGATKSAIDYRQQVAYTMTQVDKAGASFEDISRIAKDTARDIPAPFEELQGALYDIFSSMDVNTKQSETLLRGFARAAVAGQVEISTAAKATIGIMNAYKVPAERVNEVNDFMFQLVRKGVGTYDDFARVIGRAVPSAVRAGQSYQTLGGMLAFMTRNGMSAAMASASAGRALDAYSNPATIKRMEKLGITVKDQAGEFRPIGDVMVDLSGKMSKLTAPERAEAMKNLFLGSGGTIQARRFFDMAIPNIKELTSLTNSMNEAGGAADEAYDIMFKQPQTQIQLLNNNLDVFKVAIGEALIPVLNALVAAGISVLQWFNDLSPSTQKWIAYGMAAAAAFAVLSGVILVIVGAFLMLAGAAALAGVGIGAILLPIIAVIAIIAGLIAIGYLLIKHWDNIPVVAGQAWSAITQIWNAGITAVVGAWKAFTNAISQIFKALWTALKGAGSAGWTAIKAIWNAGITATKGAWNAFKNAVVQIFKALWTATVNAGKAGWNALKQIFNAGVTAARNVVVAGLNAIITRFSQWASSARATVSGGWNAMRAMFSAGGSAIRQIAAAAMAALVSQFTSGVSRAGAALGRIRSAISGAMSGAAGWLSSAGRSVVQGFINGVTGMAGAAARAVGRMASNAVAAAKSFLKIGSPSKVFQEIGHNVGEGMVVGLHDQEKNVAMAMRALQSAGIETAPFVPNAPGTAPVGFAAPVPESKGNTLNFYAGAIVLSGTNNEDDAKEFVENVRRYL